MSIIKVTPSDIETFSVVTNPSRTYSSSSTGGVTGSVYVFARRSNYEKEMAPLPAFIDATHNDSDLNVSIRSLQQVGRLARVGGYSALNSRFKAMIEDYMNKVDQQGISARKQKYLDVIRFVPPVQFNSNTVRKLIVKDQLMRYYRTSYPSAHWAYTNYNCLNFFTSSTVPTSSPDLR